MWLTVWMFRKKVRFYGEGLLAPRQTPSWRINYCRLSATAYSIYSHLSSVLEAIPSSATWGRAMPWWHGPTYHWPLLNTRINRCMSQSNHVSCQNSARFHNRASWLQTTIALTSLKYRVSTLCSRVQNRYTYRIVNAAVEVEGNPDVENVGRL